MKFDDKHTFDKPASTVIKMFSDQKYFERKYKDLGGWDISVLECEKTAKKFRIKCCYTMKSNVPLPDFVKKFVPETAVITQTDTWDIAAMTGRLEVSIKGAPVKVVADMTLKNEGKGSANNLKWDVSCGIPLVGGKIEKIVVDDIHAKAKADIAATRNILKDYS